jgi:hypothetical protein
VNIDDTNVRTVQKVSAVGWTNESSPAGQYLLCIVGITVTHNRYKGLTNICAHRR